jgi:ectoine hydroxylase-related dioxygenase (phytanoyl-CoA dioxygenase family)
MPGSKTDTKANVLLSHAQLDQYQRDGFIVVEDLLTREEVAALQTRLREYTHGGRDHSRLVIQIEPRVQRGEMKVPHWGDGIRKIDHLVEHDDLFQKLGLHPNIVGIIEQILGPDIKMFRNSLLLKPPGVGSQKGMHQDSPYWPIAPMDLCSCWFAIDDATPQNGCMGVLPGGHKDGPLPHRHVTDDYVIEESAYDPSRMLLAPVRAGGGLFFHSLVPHYTAPNRSDQWRRAIALSYMRATSTYQADGPGPVYFPVKGKTFLGCVR